MPLNPLDECEFLGPALPEPFVQFELESLLQKQNLLPKTTGEEGQKLQQGWEGYRRRLRELGASSGSVRVRNMALEPLLERLGYACIEPSGRVATREEPSGEEGGYLLV